MTLQRGSLKRILHDSRLWCTFQRHKCSHVERSAFTGICVPITYYFLRHENTYRVMPNLPCPFRNDILRRSVTFDFDKEVEEHVSLGSGPGGGARNKCKNAVTLHHLNTGIRVRCSKFRSLHENRKMALWNLQKQLEDFLLGAHGPTERKHRANNIPRSLEARHIEHQKVQKYCLAEFFGGISTQNGSAIKQTIHKVFLTQVRANVWSWLVNHPEPFSLISRILPLPGMPTSKDLITLEDYYEIFENPLSRKAYHRVLQTLLEVYDISFTSSTEEAVDNYASESNDSDSKENFSQTARDSSKHLRCYNDPRLAKHALVLKRQENEITVEYTHISTTLFFLHCSRFKLRHDSKRISCLFTRLSATRSYTFSIKFLRLFDIETLILLSTWHCNLAHIY